MLYFIYNLLYLPYFLKILALLIIINNIVHFKKTNFNLNENISNI